VTRLPRTLECARAINFNDTLADPFQPEVLLRGFEASPVLGTPQGMAVYQNGVRVNEAFGDTVNWDLIPDIAIDRIDVLSATSVFGLKSARRSIPRPLTSSQGLGSA
jgi:iron complex outermembrane recepter protein